MDLCRAISPAAAGLGSEEVQRSGFDGQGAGQNLLHTTAIESSFVICCGVGDQHCCRCYFWSPSKALNSHRQQRQQITRGHHLDQSDQRQESHDRFTSAILRTLMMMAVDLEPRSEVQIAERSRSSDLRIENRSEFWKLDFNSEGWLAGNFMPHGAPAV